MGLGIGLGRLVGSMVVGTELDLVDSSLLRLPILSRVHLSFRASTAGIWWRRGLLAAVRHRSVFRLESSLQRGEHGSGLSGRLTQYESTDA